MPLKVAGQPVVPEAIMADQNNGTSTSTAITLSFGGVDFRLVPSSVDDTSNNANDANASMVSYVQQVNNNTGAELSLKNFTGTLRVVLAQNTAQQSPSSAAQQTTQVTSSPKVGANASAATTAARVSPGAGVDGINNRAATNAAQQFDKEEPSPVLASVDKKAPSSPQRGGTNAAALSPQEQRPRSSGAAAKKKQQGLLPFATKKAPGGDSRKGSGKKDGKAGSKATPAKRNAGRLKSTVGKDQKGTLTSGKLSLTRKQKQEAAKKQQKKEEMVQEPVQENDASSNNDIMAPITLGQTAMTATQIPSQLSQSMPSQSTTSIEQNDVNMMQVESSPEVVAADAKEEEEEEEAMKSKVRGLTYSCVLTSTQGDEKEETQGTMLMEIDDDVDNGDDSDKEEEKNANAIIATDTDAEANAEANAEAISSTTARAATGPSSPIAQKGKHHPCARWGQTMTLIDHGRVLVYGGQTFDHEADSFKTLPDIHVYDMSTRKWTKPVSSESVPRTWHSATFLPERQLLISFGGDQWNEKTKKVVTTDEVMVLDTDIMLWYPPSVSGQIPSGRSGHTASLLPNTNELVVFGGVKNNKWQNSVAVLDTTRWKWSVPKIAGSAPRPRSYHTATAIGGSNGRSRLVIFGGNDDTESFDSVHVLDASNSKMSWFHPVLSGTPPSARSGHIATLLEDNKTILIYGGWDLNLDEDACKNDADMIFEDSYLLDTELWSWSKGPKVKYDGSSGVTNGGPKRVGHSAVLAPAEDGTEVLVFGGRVPNDEFTSDFQKLIVPQSNAVEM